MVDQAWAFWTTAAEETLLALSSPDIAPDTLPAGGALPLAPLHLPWGRGTDQLLLALRLCPRQRGDTGGPLTCSLARIQATQRPLQEILRWLERPAHGVGAKPRSVQQAWAALRRRLDSLRVLGPASAGLEPGGTHDWMAPVEPLCRLYGTLAGMVRATLRAEDKGRPREWRTWLEEAWTSDQGAVCPWLKDESYAPPVTFLSKPGGTATANLAEMDGLLQDARRPKNRKYVVDTSRIRRPFSAGTGTMSGGSP